MKRKIWFQTDLGFYATKEKLLKSRDALSGDFQDNKGRLTLHFKGLKDFTIQITTQGKLGIFYPETADYNLILERLKPYLVKADGSQAKILREIKISTEEKPSAEKDSLEIIDIRPKWGGVKVSIETCEKLGEPIYKVRKGKTERLIFHVEELQNLVGK